MTDLSAAPAGVFVKLLVEDLPEVTPFAVWTFGRRTDDRWEIVRWDFPTSQFEPVYAGRPTQWCEITEWETNQLLPQLARVVW